ncbi:Lon protease C-terminal proteolytic domain-containing protein [Dipodascopsis tothii]|uniref:Lon protease C-terminal proteolytic domain-containing protein n=1 Tax=Dipodascopsis tothii TaxID=44089 RepID=UPI0034CF3B53
MTIFKPKELPLFVLPPSTVLFPGIILRLTVLRTDNMALLRDRYAEDTTMGGQAVERSPRVAIGCVTARPPKDDADAGAAEPSPADAAGAVVPAAASSVHPFGTVAKILRAEKSLEGVVQIVVEGVSRFRIQALVQAQPYMVAEAKHELDGPVDLADVGVYTQLAALKRVSRELLVLMRKTSGLSPQLHSKLDAFITQASGDDAAHLPDLLVFTLDVPVADKLVVLAADTVGRRLEAANDALGRRLALLKLTQKINTTVDSNVTKKQRDFMLRQQMKAIRDELGEKDGDDDGDDVGELVKRLEAAALTPEADKIAQRELKRLKRMHPTQAEYQVCRTYLETLAEIPWTGASFGRTGADAEVPAAVVRQARRQLDEDHYGLEKVKRRLLEYLAVVRLKSLAATRARAAGAPAVERAPIILLVGPPGVGKTSLARSVAAALGREFHRISLGGVRDEAEIRGHRRTYVGAMPGVIVQGLRKVGRNDPVFLLDEIDKLGENSFHGDPSAAMLEVLDPEQNHTFTDHYVNVPIDLSKTLFIATANSLDTIPAPLLDRMETIELAGYTYLEKMHIARQYLVPKQTRANGLEPGQVEVPEDALLRVATAYTREAGVRSLEREIASVCRGKAVEYAESVDGGAPYDPHVRAADLERYLGVEKFEDELAERENRPGVVTGLAYMGSGNGGILFLEATRTPGRGAIQLTGNLGDVIKESAQLALTWVRAHSFELGLTASADDNVVDKSDIHVHAPAGAVPKDGPSAGVAMTVALVSLLSKRPVPADTAMTGEMTLRGQVLPVGGIREKVLAAHRAGITTVILPARNVKDVGTDMPENVLREIRFVYVRTIGDVLATIWPDDVRTLSLIDSRL